MSSSDPRGILQRQRANPKLYQEPQQRALQFAAEETASTLIQGQRVHLLGLGLYHYLADYFASMLRTGLELARPALPVTTLQPDPTLITSTHNQGSFKHYEQALKLQVQAHDQLIVLAHHEQTSLTKDLLLIGQNLELKLIVFSNDREHLQHQLESRQLILLDTSANHMTFVYENTVSLLHQLYSIIEQQLFG